MPLALSTAACAQWLLVPCALQGRSLSIWVCVAWGATGSGQQRTGAAGALGKVRPQLLLQRGGAEWGTEVGPQPHGRCGVWEGKAHALAQCLPGWTSHARTHARTRGRAGAHLQPQLLPQLCHLLVLGTQLGAQVVKLVLQKWWGAAGGGACLKPRRARSELQRSHVSACLNGAHPTCPEVWMRGQLPAMSLRRAHDPRLETL